MAQPKILADQIDVGTGANQIPVNDGSGVLNANTLNGQPPSYYLAGANITGTVLNATNATSATNADNATNATNASQLDGQLPSYYLDGANLTGTVDADTLQSYVTGVAADNIVKLDATAKLPAIDGSQLTNLPSGSGLTPGATITRTAENGQPILTLDNLAFNNQTGLKVDGSGNSFGIWIASLTSTSSALRIQHNNSAIQSSANGGLGNTPVVGMNNTMVGVGWGAVCYGILSNVQTDSATKHDFYASGTGTYGPFTGSHDGLVAKGAVLVEGDIVMDVSVFNKQNISNTICVNAAATLMSPAAVGVLVSSSPIPSEEDLPAGLNGADAGTIATALADYDRIVFNAVGEGQVNVVKEGGDIAIGDYITVSSTLGKGMKQADDITHNYTVAKAREAATWAAEDTSVKMIACIYLCG